MKRTVYNQHVGFRFIAIFRHPRRDTAMSYAVSPDGDDANVVLLPKSQTRLREEWVCLDLAIIRIPDWLAKNRSDGTDRNAVAGALTWKAHPHLPAPEAVKKDRRFLTHEESLAFDRYYQFFELIRIAKDLNIRPRSPKSREKAPNFTSDRNLSRLNA